MSIVTIFSGSYCHGGEVAEKIARRLGYECISREILEEASQRYNVPCEKLLRAMHGPPTFFNNVTRERERSVAYIKAAFAEYLKKNNIVYHGFAGHLLPKNLDHVLRVCIVADHDYRIKLAIHDEGVPEKKAAHIIEKDDNDRCRWTQYLFDLGPWDKNLYDIKIPMHTMSVQDAVDMICDHVNRGNLQPTPSSQQAADDFVLATKVNVALVEKGHDAEIACKNGHITILINKFAWRLERLQKKLEKIAGSVPGVVSVDARSAPRSDQARIYRKYDFEVPSKVLLVDDEKEYILTLSERLQMRNIPSQVVYDGQEALSFVKHDEPDVIVLDLMMPGIHGLDVLRRLKKERPDIEVIILTGHGTEKDEAVARELGAFAYLQKPVDVDKLAQTMKEAYAKIRKRNHATEKSTG